MTFALASQHCGQDAPLAPRAFPGQQRDVSTFSPIGRLIYGTVHHF